MSVSFWHEQTDDLFHGHDLVLTHSGHGEQGYVAAMRRRARSAARYQAARRMAVVARATGKARASTPIEERARWGKGRETLVESERRKLLRRRAEYAEELKRMAKVQGP